MESAANSERVKKFAAGALTLAAIVVLLSPVFRSPPTDSFPLSTFPMFSSLIEPVVTIDLVVGIDSSGATVTLDPGIIAGTDEIIVAGSTVHQAVQGGAQSVDLLCNEAAERAADRSGIVAVEVRTDRVDAIEWFRGNRSPLSSLTHQRCKVSR